MPNGKPGDGPVPDVCIYGIEVFGVPTDALIREIDSFTDDYGVYDPFDEVEELLWEAHAERSKTPQLHEALLQLRDRLRSEGKRPRTT